MTLSDFAKPLAHNGWAASEAFGSYTFPLFLTINVVSATFASASILRIRDVFCALPVFGALLALPGPVIYFAIAPAIAFVMWHVSIAMFASGTALVYYMCVSLPTSRAGSPRRNHNNVTRMDLLRIVVQVVAAFAAIFGVAMTIQFKNDWGVPNRASALQALVAALSCLAIIYAWSVVPLVRSIIADHQYAAMAGGDESANLEE